MSKGLNDAEVAAEMKKMTEFIRQEAQEKAREIQVKADEEHNIEKAKIVRQETINIEALYQKKMKQAEVQRKIALSNHQNKCRLRVLQSREEMLTKLFEEARSKLNTISTNQQKYEKLVHDLILQGTLLLMEDTIGIMCRKVDLQMIQSTMAQVTKEFEEKTNKKLKFTISDKYLPDNSAGGVVLSSHEGRVICNNTLESRLELAAEKLLPAIRAMLFGVTASRRFFD